MRRTVAALDLGSNTLKLTVARLDPLEVLFEASEITRIGEKLDQNGVLLDAAKARTFEGLERLVASARSRGATEIRCVGTAGLRGAKNAPEFLADVRARLGLEIEIIDGLREANLAFSAPAAEFGPGPVLVIDLGGRSTELVAGQGRIISGKTSLEIGSVRMTDRHVKHDPPADSELERVEADVVDALRSAPPVAPGATLVGVSGTVLGLYGEALGIDRMDDVVRRAEGARFSAAELERVYESLRRRTTAERIRGDVIPAGRADVIVQGAVILRAIVRHYRATELAVTHRGVRYGLLAEMSG